MVLTFNSSISLPFNIEVNLIELAKSEIHSKGYYHNTAHVWLYTANGEILLAQRSATKVICPSLWDVSVAGHVDAGEFIIQAAIREVKEEIGLELHTNDLQKIGVFKCLQSYNNAIIDNEFHHTYIGELRVPLNKLKLQNCDSFTFFKYASFEITHMYVYKYTHRHTYTYTY